MTDDRLEHANRLLKTGKINDVREILEGFLKEDRTQIYAWSLYAETYTKVADKKRVWEYCLRSNPDSFEARRALSELMDTTNVQPQGNNKHTWKRKTSPVFVVFAGFAGLLILAVIVRTVMLLASQPDDPAPYRHTQPVEYYLYVPDDYSSDGTSWPLFVGLHGTGGSGLDCWNMWQAYAEKEGFILLCPSIPGDGRGYRLDVGENTVWSAVNDVRKNYRVNLHMFLAGFSGGAYFIQGFALHYPNAVSGLAILSSGYYVPGLQTRVPILLVIGGADHPESIKANNQLFTYLSENNFDVEYYILPGVGHWPASKAKQLTIELFRKSIGK